MKKYGDWVMRISMAFVIAIFALIAGMANFIIRDARQALLADAAARTESFSRASREAFSPKLDLFWLHFLVNDFARDKVFRYALVTDAQGKILSHSLPEKIGGRDNTPEGRFARQTQAPHMQIFKGADNLEYYYFSSPVVLGKTRLGTAAAALNTVTIAAALSDTRNKLLIILGAALISLLLLFQIRHLVRKERDAARLKSDMVHTVSHEFNNALTTIDACVFLLRETEPPGGDENRDTTYRMMASSSKLLRLYVKNILNEARMESGKFRINKSPVSLIDLAKESVGAMSELIRQKNISMSTDIPDGCRLLVDADPEALALVVANLVGNAVKYTSQNGKVMVSLALEENPLRVVFNVEDTGMGISAEEVKKIQAGFYRTSEGRAAAEGFGLGLKISNEMLLLHGTALEVRSEQGKGSVFSFSLPILETNCRIAAGPLTARA